MYPFYIDDVNCGDLKVYTDGGYTVMHVDCLHPVEETSEKQIYRAYAFTTVGKHIKIGIMEPVNNRMLVKKSFSKLQLQSEGFDIEDISFGRGFRLEEEPVADNRDRADTMISDGWEKTEALQGIIKDPVLRNSLKSAEGLLVKKEDYGYVIAEPLVRSRPLRLAPVMCIAGLISIDGNDYLAVGCNTDGMPVSINRIIRRAI